MIKLYMRFTNDIEIYADGTLETVFSVSIEKRALGLPILIKLKYECLAPSNFGRDLPLENSDNKLSPDSHRLGQKNGGIL
jgi:hypothetical protein